MKKRKRDSSYFVIYLKKKEADLKTKDIRDVESKQTHGITNDNITEVKSKPYMEPTNVNLIDMIKNTKLEERVRTRSGIYSISERRFSVLKTGTYPKNEFISILSTNCLVKSVETSHSTFYNAKYYRKCCK